MNKIDIKNMINKQWISILRGKEYNGYKNTIDTLCDIYKLEVSKIADKIQENVFCYLYNKSDNDIKDEFIKIKYSNKTNAEKNEIKDIFPIESCYEIVIHKHIEENYDKLKDKLENIKEEILSCLE